MAAGQIPAPLLNLQKDIGYPATWPSWNQAIDSFARFARKPGQERWHLKDPDITKNKRDQINKDLAELGFIHAVKPSHTHYQAAVITGGAVPRMILRIEYLISLWQQGIRFDQIILIAGQRPLEDFDNLAYELKHLQSENKVASLQTGPKNIPQHEAEAQRLLYQLYNKPAAMTKIPVDAEDTPRRWDPISQIWIRPSTRDTFSQLIKTHKRIDHFLIVTSQPYVLYMDTVYKNQLINLTKPPKIDVVGPPAPPATRTVEYLNAVYEWLKAITPLMES